MSNEKEKSKRIAKNTLFMFFRMLLVVCIGLYTSRVVLNTLGIEDFGIYNIVGSIVVFLMFFKNALTNATYRFLAYELGKKDMTRLSRTFAMSFNMNAVLAGILFILLEGGGIWIINNYLNIAPDRLPAAHWVFQFSILCFIIEILKTPYNSCVIAHERMDFYALTSIIEVVLKLGIVYCLLIVDWDKLILYAALIALVALIIGMWYVIYCLKHFPETHYRFFWDKKMLRQLLSYSGWSVVVNAVDISVNQVNNFFFNLFGGVVVNAAMGITNQVNAHLNNFISSFTQSFNPQIIKSYAEGDHNYFMKLIFSTSKLSYFLLFAAAFPLFMFIDFILQIWLGTVPPMTGTFIRLVIGYMLFDSFSAPLWQAVHATGQLKIHQSLIAGIKILNVPLSWYLLSNGYPMASALAAWTALNGVCALVRIFYMHTLINLPLKAYFREVIGSIILISALSILLPLYYYFKYGGNDWTSLASASAMFFVCYIPLIYYVGLNTKERTLLTTMLKRKLPFRIPF